MRPRRTSRILLAAAVLASLVAAREARALTACTAAAISAADPGCPTGTGPCTITKDFTVPDGCTLDFGTRAVALANGKELTIGSGTVILKAGSLTIRPGAVLNGRGEGASPPGDHGGSIRVETTGDVTLEKTSAQGRIDVSGNARAGTIRIFAGGTVTVAGRLNADKITPLAGGGIISVDAGGDIVTLAESTISATTAGGASVSLLATGDITLGEQVDVSGDDGGELRVQAGGGVVLHKVLASGEGEAGSGGSVTAIAGTRVQVLGDILAHAHGSTDGSGGDGGDIDIESQFGDLTITTTLDADGAIVDGTGGFIDLEAAGALMIAATAVVTARANGGQGDADEVDFTAQTITIAGTVDVSGGDAGGLLDVSADGAVTVSGSIAAGSFSDGTSGGGVDIEAGVLGRGNLLVSGLIDVTGGGCDPVNGCGLGGDVDLRGCDVTIASSAHVVTGGGAGGTTVLTAREQLTVSGTVDATGSAASGSNGLIHPSRKPPVVGSGLVTPSPTTFPRATCTAAGSPANCLDACPVCGNGTVEFPETCDDAGTQGCDGCSAFCRTESCNDGIACTTDTCNPQLGCPHPTAPNGTPCPDSVACNGIETCHAGLCSPGPLPDCDDGTTCTLDSCVEPGGCQHTPVAAGTSCTDNNACTVGNTCDGNGVCGTVLVCDDHRECTTDTCDPARGCVYTNRSGVCTPDANQCTDDVCAGGNCIHLNRPNGSACSDGAFCTTTDTCQNGTCFPGPPRSCADTNVCTSDACNESTDTCDHAPIVPCCGNGVVESGEQCDDGNTNNADGCSNTCRLVSGCGDGVVQAGEECDAGPGNANTPDAPCRPDCRRPRCADGVADPGRGEQCDDGNTTSGDGCSSRCYLEPPATAGRVGGKGSAVTDCVLEWAIDHPIIDTRTGQPSVKQTCRDGDPTCDAGATANQCLFHVWVCANNLDPRFPQCTPTAPSFGTVAFVEVRKPKQSDADKRPEDALNLAQLRSAANAALGAPFNDCGPRLDIRVPRKTAIATGSKSLKLRGITTQTLLDNDSLKLICTP